MSKQTQKQYKLELLIQSQRIPCPAQTIAPVNYLPYYFLDWDYPSPHVLYYNYVKVSS